MENDAEAKDVTSMIDLLSPSLLGRHVGNGSHHLAGIGLTSQCGLQLASLPQRFQEQATSFIDLAEIWDLGRVLSLDHPLPSWARSREGPWTRTGHRILFRLWDHVGKAVSLRARSVDPGTTKGLVGRGLFVLIAPAILRSMRTSECDAHGAAWPVKVL